jgi:hypothetical protein
MNSPLGTFIAISFANVKGPSSETLFVADLQGIIFGMVKLVKQKTFFLLTP